MQIPFMVERSFKFFDFHFKVTVYFQIDSCRWSGFGSRSRSSWWRLNSCFIFTHFKEENNTQLRWSKKCTFVWVKYCTIWLWLWISKLLIKVCYVVCFSSLCKHPVTNPSKIKLTWNILVIFCHCSWQQMALHAKFWQVNRWICTCNHSEISIFWLMNFRK